MLPEPHAHATALQDSLPNASIGQACADEPPLKPPHRSPGRDGRLHTLSQQLTTLTILQYDSLLGIGWAQDLDFAHSGALLAIFAVGLNRGIRGGSKSGPALLLVAGLAMALLAFETDPIKDPGPHTARVDSRRVVRALSPRPRFGPLLALAAHARRSPLAPARPLHARYRSARDGLALLARLGILIFLVVVLVWFGTTTIKLRRVTRQTAD
jgi:hypothetical protein